MPIPTLEEGFTEFEIIINPNLKFIRTETLKKGIKRYWGYDNIDKNLKLMYIQYPKKYFSRTDMKRILPKYEKCKLCIVGKKFINENNNNTIMNVSIIDLFGKIPKIGRYISGNRHISEPIIMQLLATISRYPIAMFTSPLSKRLASIVIGILGEVGVVYLIKNGVIQGEWAEFFANYITSATEYPAKGNAAFDLKSDWAKLKRKLKTGNFGGITNTLIGDVANMRRAIRGYGVKFKNSFNKLRRGRLRATENTMSTIARAKSLGGHSLGVAHAGDYKYTDTAHRFRRVSDFGSGFRSKRRLRESGNAIYSAIMT